MKKAFINSKLINIFNKHTKNKAAVFMLHRFRDPGIGYTWDDLAVSSDYFEQCLAYLKENQYNVISLKDLISKIKNRSDFYKTVCFTIDDGYVDFKNIAFPLFKKYNFPATVFLTTGFAEGMMMWWDKVVYLVRNTSHNELVATLADQDIQVPLVTVEDKADAVSRLMVVLKTLSFEELSSGIEVLSRRLEVELPEKTPIEYSALTWDDAREMEQSLISFEPHTVTHAILSRLSVEQQRLQIQESIGAIQRELKGEPEIYCYPNGTAIDFNQDTLRLIQEEGMVAGCTATRGYFDFESNEHITTLRRIPFPKQFERFILYVSGYGASKDKQSNNRYQ